MRTPFEIEATARDGAFSRFDIEVLQKYWHKMLPGDVYLEVGVDRGRSLQIARDETIPGVEIYGIDKKKLEDLVDKATFIHGDSRTYQLGKKVDLIFIDGDHSYEGVKADIQNWYPQMAEGGVMTFHDCDGTSPGVVQAFDEFVAEIEPKAAWKDPNEQCGMAVIEL